MYFATFFYTTCKLSTRQNIVNIYKNPCVCSGLLVPPFHVFRSHLVETVLQRMHVAHVSACNDETRAGRLVSHQRRRVPRNASIALTLVTAARFFDIAWRARTPLYIAHCLIYCIFLFSVPFFQYYEMSYGLNVEMHKQVSPARVHLNFK